MKHGHFGSKKTPLPGSSLFTSSGVRGWKYRISKATHNVLVRRKDFLEIFGNVSWDSWMYPCQRTHPYGKSLYTPYIVGINHQESLENTINTMGNGYTVRGTPNCPSNVRVFQGELGSKGIWRNSFGPAIYCIYVDQPRSKVDARGLISSNPLKMTFQVIQKNLCKCFFWGTVHGFFCLVPVGSIPAK